MPNSAGPRTPAQRTPKGFKGGGWRLFWVGGWPWSGCTRRHTAPLTHTPAPAPVRSPGQRELERDDVGCMRDVQGTAHRRLCRQLASAFLCEKRGLLDAREHKESCPPSIRWGNRYQQISDVSAQCAGGGAGRPKACCPRPPKLAAPCDSGLETHTVLFSIINGCVSGRRVSRAAPCPGRTWRTTHDCRRCESVVRTCSLATTPRTWRRRALRRRQARRRRWWCVFSASGPAWEDTPSHLRFACE